MSKRCNECLCDEGVLHAPFCLNERCPFCLGQLASCGCIQRELSLTDEERVALDEYVDDSVEPLLGVVQRWEKKLARKGRIPFSAA